MFPMPCTFCLYYSIRSVNKTSGSLGMRFVADAMLGRLAKWLRVLGYDTHYQSHYSEGQLGELVRKGRRLLTRDNRLCKRYREAVFLSGDHVDEQLSQLYASVDLHPDPSKWFSRCVRCNTLLQTASEPEVREMVPEYVFYENRGQIRICPSCKRCFWPGSHRMRMMNQLRTWGMPVPFEQETGP